MKKLFFVFAILVFFSSCIKHAEPQPTTYQIFNNSNRIVTDIEYLDGSMYEVIVHHYNKTILVREDNIDIIATAGGDTGLRDVPPNTDHFRVSFKFLPSKSPDYNAPWNVRFYMIAFKQIVRGDNNIFGINGGSFISDTIAKSNNDAGFLKVVRTLNKRPIDTQN